MNLWTRARKLQEHVYVPGSDDLKDDELELPVEDDSERRQKSDSDDEEYKKKKKKETSDLQVHIFQFSW